jgi:hypothetical protein
LAGGDAGWPTGGSVEVVIPSTRDSGGVATLVLGPGRRGDADGGFVADGNIRAADLT